jgi:hypothetical protein
MHSPCQVKAGGRQRAKAGEIARLEIARLEIARLEIARLEIARQGDSEIAALPSTR